jgi:inosose dehydratase
MTIMQRVAAAPISWGICEVPGWGFQLDPDRVLGEMRDIGFTSTDLGAAGWLPTDPAGLREILDRHQLRLLGAFVPLVLHDPDQADEARRATRDATALLADAGGSHFVTAPVTTLDWGPRQPLGTPAWDHLVRMLDEVEAVCRDRGLRQVLHQHAGTVVQDGDELDLVLERSPVQVVLDTGHLAVGGVDAAEFARRHPDRVGLVHLKDGVRSIAARYLSGELSWVQAVQAGLFRPLGEGELPIADTIRALEAAGYDGWYVLEQDVALAGDEPAPGEGPARDVATSVAYLRTLATDADAVLAPGEVPPRPVHDQR